MSDQGNEPAFPTLEGPRFVGLTKLELFAAMAMKGLLSCSYTDGQLTDEIARSAVTNAEALLTELEKE